MNKVDLIFIGCQFLQYKVISENEEKYKNIVMLRKHDEIGNNYFVWESYPTKHFYDFKEGVEFIKCQNIF